MELHGHFAAILSGLKELGFVLAVFALSALAAELLAFLVERAQHAPGLL